MSNTTSLVKLDVDRDVAPSDDILVPVAYREPLPAKIVAHRRSPRLILTLGIALLLIAAAVAYGGYYWVVGRFLESTDDAYVQADSTIIAPKVSGYLSAVLVEDNQPVRKPTSRSPKSRLGTMSRPSTRPRPTWRPRRPILKTSRPNSRNSRPSSRRPGPPLRSTRPI